MCPLIISAFLSPLFYTRVVLLQNVLLSLFVPSLPLVVDLLLLLEVFCFSTSSSGSFFFLEMRKSLCLNKEGRKTDGHTHGQVLGEEEVKPI